jgi:hypothetical protein
MQRWREWMTTESIEPITKFPERLNLLVAGDTRHDVAGEAAGDGE